LASPRPDRPTLWLTLLAAVPALVLAAVQVRWCWPFFSDDSFISLRFAARLLAGEGLTWTDGDAVEGYSNLLWVLATAGLGALGLELVFAARLLGAVCTAAGLVLLARAGRPRDGASVLTASLAPLLVAGTPAVTAWTLGGLEGPMVMLWLCWGLGGLRDACSGPAPSRRLAALGLPFALLCLTRPDGPLWIAVAAATLAVARRSLGAASALAAPALGAFAGQLVFRLGYHGDLVPNTAHVKVGLSPDRLALGGEYVRDGLLAAPGLAAAAALAACWLACRRGARGDLLLLLPLAAWLAYLVVIGGDHFVAHRLFQPALPALALLVAAACRAGAGRRGFVVAALVLGGAGAGANAWRARADSLTAMARGERWEWVGEAIGEALGKGLGAAAPRIAVDAAGAVPYYSGLPALDMLGLNDRTIARTPVPPWADGAARAGGLVRPQGHTHGNGTYVLDQAPDLILFAQPPGLPLPVFVSGLELEYDRRFRDGYRLVALELPAAPRDHLPAGPITSWLWVRVAGRAGVRRDGAAIVVPAYLLGGFRLARPIQCRFERPSGTAAAAARDAAQAELLAWVLRGRNGAMVPGRDGRFELVARRAEPLVLELPPELWREHPRWQVVFDPADAPWHGELAGGTLRATPRAGAPLPARLVAIVLQPAP
jgi:hypothetical protein